MNSKIKIQLKKTLEQLMKRQHNAVMLNGLENRRNNELYSKLHEECLVQTERALKQLADIGLQKKNKKIRDNSLIEKMQNEFIKKFTGKSRFSLLMELYDEYMGSGEVIEAFRVLKILGAEYSKNIRVRITVFEFFLAIGETRKAESCLISVIVALKKCDQFLTVYAILLFEMNKIKEAVLIFRVCGQFLNFFLKSWFSNLREN